VRGSEGEGFDLKRRRDERQRGDGDLGGVMGGEEDCDHGTRKNRGWADVVKHCGPGTAAIAATAATAGTVGTVDIMNTSPWTPHYVPQLTLQMLGQYTAALKDFDDALLYMRGNQTM
jgi:hypothetical protein